MLRKKGTAPTKISQQMQAIRRHRYELAQRTTTPSRRDFTPVEVRVGQTIRQVLRGGAEGLVWTMPR